MRKLNLSEFRNLPFGSYILVRIIRGNGSYIEDIEEYEAVVVLDKIYYKDGKVDNKRTIEEYVHDGFARVYLLK